MTDASAAPETPPHDCARCPRLAAFLAENRKTYPDFHNGPVASFGPLDARLLIVGLAPGVSGANRTGRPFTGDWAEPTSQGAINKTHNGIVERIWGLGTRCGYYHSVGSWSEGAGHYIARRKEQRWSYWRSPIRVRSAASEVSGKTNGGPEMRRDALHCSSACRQRDYRNRQREVSKQQT